MTTFTMNSRQPVMRTAQAERTLITAKMILMRMTIVMMMMTKMITMRPTLYNEKQTAGDEDGAGREDDQLAKLEELCLLLVLHHTHDQDGHTWNTQEDRKLNSFWGPGFGLIKGG